MRPEAEFVELIDKFRNYCRAEYETNDRKENWAVLISSPENIHYFTGFTSPLMIFSTSRPWYFLITPTELIPVIPTLGVDVWRQCSWVETQKMIYDWPSPTPHDEGIELLSTVLQKHVPQIDTLGVELGQEHRLGFPVGDFLKLQNQLNTANVTVVDCVPVVRRCRNIKSPWEIEMIRTVCHMVSRAFDELPRLLEELNLTIPTVTMRDAVRVFKMECFRQGVEEVIYIAATAGKSGYQSVIAINLDKVLSEGDVICIDTGCRYQGYFCDFDRNVVLGKHDPIVEEMHEALWDTTEAGLNALKVGDTAEDIWKAQAVVLRAAGMEPSEADRFGHGLGKSLTEPPSNKLGDHTLIEENMVFTIEPAVFHNGLMQCHEENAVVTSTGYELLAPRGPRDIPVIPWIDKNVTDNKRTIVNVENVIEPPAKRLKMACNTATTQTGQT